VKDDSAETVAITGPILSIVACYRKISWQLSITNEAPMMPDRSETWAHDCR
jgi:hypothetical protein